jgi:hypothetical protein
VIKIVIDDEEERALSPEVEELLRRRAAEVGFSTLDWIVQLLELHAEQDEEDEPEDAERVNVAADDVREKPSDQHRLSRAKAERAAAVSDVENDPTPTRFEHFLADPPVLLHPARGLGLLACHIELSRRRGTPR